MRRAAKKLLFLIFLAAAGWGIWTKVILAGGNLHWDEAAHALRGLLIAEDIARGDWLGFLYDTYRQIYWPPLHSWLTAAAFLVAGIGVTAARAVSLVSFLGAALAIYGAALYLGGRRDDTAALVSAALFLACPPLMAYAGLCMLEVPGIFFLSLTLLVFVMLASGEKQEGRYLILGVLLAATYFVRTNYGILLMAAVFVDAIIEARLIPRRLLCRRNLYILLPVLVSFAVWFAYPPKLIGTFQALVNQPLGVESAFSAEGLLFYPRALLRIFGSGWVMVLVPVSFLLSLRYITDRGVRFLILIVLIQFAIGQLHHSKADRYLFPVLPPLFLLTGHVVGGVRDYALRTGKPRLSSIAGLAAALILAGSAWLFAGHLRPEVKAYSPEVSEHLIRELGRFDRTLLIGSQDLDDPGPPVTDWRLIVEEGVMEAVHSGALMNLEEERRLVDTLLGSGAPIRLTRGILPVLRRSERPGGVRSVYPGLPPGSSYSRSPELLSRFLEGIMETFPAEGVVAVASTREDSRHDLAFIEAGLPENLFERVSTREFPSSKAVIAVYRRIP